MAKKKSVESPKVRTRPVRVWDREFIDGEIEALEDFSKLETSLSMEAFCAYRGYGAKNFYERCRDYPDLRDAVDIAITVFAARRDYLAATRKIDPAYAIKTFPLYCAKYRDWYTSTRQAANQGISISLVKQLPWQNADATIVEGSATITNQTTDINLIENKTEESKDLSTS